MKKVVVGLKLWVICSLTLIFVESCSCDRRIQPGNPFDGYYPDERYDNAVPESRRIDEIVSLCEYEPKKLWVYKGTTFEDALRHSQPHWSQSQSVDGIGGPKLIAEMSADASGFPYSSDNTKDCQLRVRPLHELKLHVDTTPSGLYSRVFNKEVKLESCIINGSPSFFDGHFVVNMSLCNNTENQLFVVIARGSMIESEGKNVQNIVVTERREYSLRPHQRCNIGIPAFCASHHRSDPSNPPTRGRITPYVLNAPADVYNSQEAIWDYIEAPSRNKIAFYAWGSGDETGHGEVSKLGHAFVWIKSSGYWGFGPETGDLFLGAGVVFDHTKSRPYATDSCIIYVADQQLLQAQNKLEELKVLTPDYNLGFYDCTSFVMDIADAAGIYYGIRSLVFTPTGFIEKLKRYNTY